MTTHWLHARAKEMLLSLTSDQRRAYFLSRLDGSSTTGLEQMPFGEYRDLPFDIVAASLSDDMKKEKRCIHEDAISVVRSALEAAKIAIEKTAPSGLSDKDLLQMRGIGDNALRVVDGSTCELFKPLVRAIAEVSSGGSEDLKHTHFLAVSALSALKKEPEEIEFWILLARVDDTAMLACRTLAEFAAERPEVIDAVKNIKSMFAEKDDRFRLSILDEIFPSVEYSSPKLI
jgi:hypothetical protein